MARVEAEGAGTNKIAFEIPDCKEGGDHSALFQRAVKTILDDENVIIVYFGCKPSGSEVVAWRDPDTGVISASLKKATRRDSWLGM